MVSDLINGLFEFAGALSTLANLRRLLRDKKGPRIRSASRLVLHAVGLLQPLFLSASPPMVQLFRWLLYFDCQWTLHRPGAKLLEENEMSKISKTAKSSMGIAKVEKSVIPDAELIRLLRIDCASAIYPGVQGTHALLRAYDALEAEKKSALSILNQALNGHLYESLDDAVRQLVTISNGARDAMEELKTKMNQGGVLTSTRPIEVDASMTPIEPGS